MYHLKVNKKAVSPDKISCGERNALALIYFSAEIAKETEFQKLYYDEMLLVIDDSVSSFDVENRVGILSFLRYRLNQVLSSCATTKILMMTHDVSVMFGLQKAMDEISSNCAGVGKCAHFAALCFRPRFAAQPLADLPPYGCGVQLAGALLDSRPSDGDGGK